MARVTAQQAATKWQQRLSSATQQITDGVNGVTVAPGAKAAAAKALWLQKVQASQNKWAANVAAVTLQSWQNSMITVGIPRVATGAAAKVGKVESFMSQFLPYLDAGVAKVNAMPKGDINASIARATAMIQYNANFKRNPGA